MNKSSSTVAKISMEDLGETSSAFHTVIKVLIALDIRSVVKPPRQSKKSPGIARGF